MRSIGTSEYPIPSSSASLDSRHERQSNRLATRTRNSVVMARWDMYGSAGCLVADDISIQSVAASDLSHGKYKHWYLESCCVAINACVCNRNVSGVGAHGLGRICQGGSRLSRIGAAARTDR